MWQNLTKPTRGQGAGRKPLGDAKMLTGTFRRTAEQAAKLEALGGGAWLRAQIDAAPWPRGTKPK